MTFENCFDIWNCGRKYKVKQIVKNAGYFIGKNLRDLVEKEGFNNLTEEDMEEIMKISKGSVSSLSFYFYAVDFHCCT